MRFGFAPESDDDEDDDVPSLVSPGSFRVTDDLPRWRPRVTELSWLSGKARGAMIGERVRVRVVAGSKCRFEIDALGRVISEIPTGY